MKPINLNEKRLFNICLLADINNTIPIDIGAQEASVSLLFKFKTTGLCLEDSMSVNA